LNEHKKVFTRVSDKEGRLSTSFQCFEGVLALAVLAWRWRSGDEKKSQCCTSILGAAQKPICCTKSHLLHKNFGVLYKKSSVLNKNFKCCQGKGFGTLAHQ